MSQLDKVIAARDMYRNQRESRIDSLRQKLASASDDTVRFSIIGDLIDEYNPLNTDSAFVLSMRREAVARKIGDNVFVTNARMNRANTLFATGMYKETLEIMDSISSDELPAYLRPYYFHIMRTVYGRLADFAAFAPERDRYAQLTDMYRDSLLSVNDTTSLTYALIKADQLNSHGHSGEAITVLNRYKANHHLSEHENAVFAWTLSEAYGAVGDKANQKEQLLISSISDMKSAVKEYVSLRQLALLLYTEGDLDRAYRLMTIAVDDAAECNARQRIIELSDSYPMINGIYIDTIKRQQHTLIWFLGVITILSVILLAALIYLRKQMHRITIAQRTIEEANERLNHTNHELSEANRAIAENSRLKEVYIGRYMDQCLAYIERLDSYRKSISKLVTTGKTDELRNTVKSTTHIDDELKSFYDNFDRTFLSLFPTFVEDFNKLLLPDEALRPKKPGSLTTELRIFALIRLGISDSDKIAKFLRYSLTTIYNYRTKVRNKAIGDRNKLEERVLEIGRKE